MNLIFINLPEDVLFEIAYNLSSFECKKLCLTNSKLNSLFSLLNNKF